MSRTIQRIADGVAGVVVRPPVGDDEEVAIEAGVSVTRGMERRRLAALAKATEEERQARHRALSGGDRTHVRRDAVVPKLDRRWDEDPRYAALTEQRADIERRAAEADRARIEAEGAFATERSRAADAEVESILGRLDDKRLQGQRRATAAAEQRAKDARIEDERYERALAVIDGQLADLEPIIKAEYREAIRAEARKAVLVIWDAMRTASVANDTLYWLQALANREQLGPIGETDWFDPQLALPGQHSWVFGAGRLAGLGSQLIEAGLIEDPWPGA